MKFRNSESLNAAEFGDVNLKSIRPIVKELQASKKHRVSSLLNIFISFKTETTKKRIVGGNPTIFSMGGNPIGGTPT